MTCVGGATWQKCPWELREGGRLYTRETNRSRRHASPLRTPTCHRTVSLAQGAVQQKKGRKTFRYEFYSYTHTLFFQKPRPHELWGQRLMEKVFSEVPLGCPHGSGLTTVTVPAPSWPQRVCMQCLVSNKWTCLFSGFSKPVAWRRTQ